jgi:hypothetical protein
MMIEPQDHDYGEAPFSEFLELAAIAFEEWNSSEDDAAFRHL